MQEFCPLCFAELDAETVFCPRCGTDIERAQAAEDYESRLIRAIRHPVAEVRAGAIEALRLRRATSACSALADAALSSPTDIDQSCAIIDCLAGMLPASVPRKCLRRIARHHPARTVRRMAARKLASPM